MFMQIWYIRTPSQSQNNPFGKNVYSIGVDVSISLNWRLRKSDKKAEACC
jgi:hypothetical protein